jgi:hypothetical protein
VTLLEHVGEEPPCYLYFECYADDDDHALEQAMNAYPEGLMIELERTPPNYIRRGISDGHATGHHYARTSGGRHHAEQ